MKQLRVHIVSMRNEPILLGELSGFLGALNRVWEGAYVVSKDIKTPFSKSIFLQGQDNKEKKFHFLWNKKTLKEINKIIVSKISKESPFELVITMIGTASAIVVFLTLLAKLRTTKLQNKKLELEIDKLRAGMHPRDRVRAREIPTYVAAALADKEGWIEIAAESLNRTRITIDRMEIKVTEAPAEDRAR